MNKFTMTAAAALVALAGAAQAATIKVTAFDIAGFNTATTSPDMIIQDFEAIGVQKGRGQLPGPLDTNVGTFSAIAEGEAGSGSTCTASTGDCTKLFLNNTTVNGQGNSIPTVGIWSLNANDTFGISWDVLKKEGGSLFNRVVFVMMDAADQGANVKITVGETIANFAGLIPGNRQLIVVDFAERIDAANIEIRSSKLNDSFSIDGASVGVVPLPAGGLLLLTGLGALALRRRRQAA